MLPLSQTIVIVDVETTGGSPSGHRIIEIGMIRLEPGKKVSVFNSLINPERFVSHYIFELTGINPFELERAPSFREAARRIEDFLKDAVFVAHNARFDYAFVKNEFMRLGMPFSAKTLCSVKLSRTLFPEFKKHDLSSLIERYELQIAKRHRALDDAKAVLDFFRYVCAEKGEESFREVFERLHSRRLAQCDVPPGVFRELPEAAGVYIFRGENGQTLYVGKAKNIKERVLSHFYEDHKSGKELLITEKTKSIEVRRTAGELSALLLESELVKSLHPIYNRYLKTKKQLIVAIKKSAPGAYFTVGLEAVAQIDPAKEILGIYPSLRKAKETLFETADLHKLCPKLLGLERSGDACFSYHINKCKGACVGAEAAIAYNMRFLEAFGNRVIKRWPFSGAVVLEERDSTENTGTVFVVDRWIVMEKIEYSENGQNTIPQKSAFNFDVYKILARAISKPGTGLKIYPLDQKSNKELIYERD